MVNQRTQDIRLAIKTVACPEPGCQAERVPAPHEQAGSLPEH